MEQSESNQMGESQETIQPASYERESSGVSFPTIGQQKKSGGAKTLLIVGILVLVAILGFVIYKSASKTSEDTEALPTTFDNLTTPSSDQTMEVSTPMPSIAPSVTLDKTKVQVQVQNGTGIPGEAAYLQTQFSTLGYTNVKVGNSDSNVTTTTVTFAKSLDAAAVAEITQKLNSIYATVSTQTSSSATFDVVVVTGLRKGATPKASGTPAPVASGSPSATPKASTTPTPSPTPTKAP